MTGAIFYPKDDLPRKWPHFDAGWYIRVLMYATFGPYTEEEAYVVHNRRAMNLGFVPSDEIFHVQDPSDIEVMQFANSLGDT